MQDELTQEGDHFELRLKFDTGDCRTKVVELRFSRAEVLRAPQNG